MEHSISTKLSYVMYINLRNAEHMTLHQCMNSSDIHNFPKQLGNNLYAHGDKNLISVWVYMTVDLISNNIFYFWATLWGFSHRFFNLLFRYAKVWSHLYIQPEKLHSCLVQIAECFSKAIISKFILNFCGALRILPFLVARNVFDQKCAPLAIFHLLLWCKLLNSSQTLFQIKHMSCSGSDL